MECIECVKRCLFLPSKNEYRLYTDKKAASIEIVSIS
jgi:hypothetical protein